MSHAKIIVFASYGKFRFQFWFVPKNYTSQSINLLTSLALEKKLTVYKVIERKLEWLKHNFLTVNYSNTVIFRWKSY